MQHAGYNHGKLHLISVVGLNFDSVGHRLAQGMPRGPVALQVCESFEHLIHDKPRRKDVGLEISISNQQFRRHIPDIALLTLDPRPVLNDKSEVTDFDAVLVREKEIVRFEIEMQEVGRVDAVQAR
eukprot:CAMPEP_0179422048 /NCGR_PEP_ID=MMETSP0799-20121207/10189_1 /TAXON_ID=46947 /ORGANISM="Geminigera cryophila, Strain CCMP2564" /LENGTH=125 /DNA_ID=CAMNT_0021196091 /DNA_START=660 /DNA_END=1040 /DNA_ORIENTATION=+